MVQGAPQTAGRFAEQVRMYKAPPPEVSSEQFYETGSEPSSTSEAGPSNRRPTAPCGRACGRAGPLGRGTAGVHARLCALVDGLGALCEFCPGPRIGSPWPTRETDRAGLAVAHFAYTKCENDKLWMAAAQESMNEILEAAGATETE